MHDLQTKENQRQGYIEWMAGLDHVTISKPDERLPNAHTYDVDGTLAEFGRYFNNSISWMIADVCRDGGVKNLHLYGVDMAHHTEYSGQRPSCEYMVGVARGLGINVYVPPQSDLLKTRYLYGIEDPGDFEHKLKARHEELKMRAGKCDNDAQTVNEQLTATCGAVGELRQVLEQLNGNLPEDLVAAMREREAAMLKAIEKLKAERQIADQHRHMVTGALEEISYEREWL
jgi:hypothetical protein